MSDTELLLASRCCNQCLTTPRRIVSPERAAEILDECRDRDTHFICHKGSICGQNVHCRGVFEAIGPSFGYRFAKAVGVPIREIDPEELSHDT